MRCLDRLRALLPILLVGMAVAACGESGPPARGFGSRQLVPSRDSTLAYYTSPRPGVIIYTSTPVVAGGPIEYWQLDLVSGQAQDLGTTAPTISADPSSGDRFSCTFNGMDQTSTLVVTDQQTGVQTSIDSLIASYPFCPTDTDPTLVVWRRDAAGVLSVWTGPYDELHRVPVALIVQSIVTFDLQRATVAAATPDAPGATGLYAIDLATGAATVVVPAVLGDTSWAPGATPEGSLASASLKTPEGVYGNEVMSVGDHFIYTRAMSDGGSTTFVGPLPPSSASRELALMRPHGPMTPVATGVASQDGYGPLPSPQRLAWLRSDPAGASDVITVWAEGQQRITSCPLPSGAPLMIGLEADTPDNVLFVADTRYQAPSGDVLVRGPVLLVRPGADGDAACVPLAAGDVISAGISAGGSSLYWLSATPSGDSTSLWTASGDGSGARQAGGGYLREPAFSGETEVELAFGLDLVWLDVRDDPVRLHYIAERVFGGRMDLTPPWLITGYRFDADQQTGTIGVIDRLAGTARPISPAVAWYMPVALPAPDGDGGAPSTSLFPLGILYLVRGHNPSPQDGLWLATINADDLR